MLKNTSNQNCLIYLNRHSDNPKLFSLKQKGIVTKRFNRTAVRKANFVVHTGGHYRAMIEQKRNVHAYVKTSCLDNLDELNMDQDSMINRSYQVRYHYKEGAAFKIQIGGREIQIDEDYVFSVVFLDDHRSYIPKRLVIKYLLDRKIDLNELTHWLIPNFIQEYTNKIKYLLSLEDELRNGHFIHQGFKFNEGICGNLLIENDDILRTDAVQDGFEARTIIHGIQRHIFSSWPEFSGDVVYPILIKGVNPLQETAEDQYSETENKWSGEQLETRLRLLKFMLEKLGGKVND